jgi:asparagine synthase (glutamine-hydrolysing)
VARIAREHVKVVLTGDGGDEIFGGYNRYGLCDSLWPGTRRIPNSIRRSLSRNSSGLPPLLSRAVNIVGDRLSSTQAEWSLRIDKALRVVASESPFEAYRRLMACTHDLFIIERDAGDAGHKNVSTFLREAMRWDQAHYLPDDNLARVDRASMAASLETRAPLLDYRLLELSWRLPDSMLVRNGQRKWVLRQLLAKYLPRDLIYRAC